MPLPARRFRVALVATAVCLQAAACAAPGSPHGDRRGATAATTGCTDEGGTDPVAAPRFVRRIDTGETGWFSSPGLVDLDGDGRLEIVAPFYSTFVFDATGHQLGRGTASKGRVYAPSVVTDLEGDGITDIVVGGGRARWRRTSSATAGCTRKQGWPASTRSGGQSPEARGLAAADLDGDGTGRGGGDDDQHLPHRRPGLRLQRPRQAVPAARAATPPRGRATTGCAAPGNDLHVQPGRQPRLRRVRRERRHRQHRRRPRAGDHRHLRQPPDQRVQPRRHLDPGVPVVHQPRVGRRRAPDGMGPVHPLGRPAGSSARHYHLHTGAWPSPARRRGSSGPPRRPSVADLDGDGHNEVVGIPNAELHIPYRTQGYAFMVLDGAYGDGTRSARRHAGFETAADVEPARVTGPAATGTRPAGSRPRPWSTSAATPGPRSSSALPGGKVYAVGPDGHRRWTYTYARAGAKTFASEVVAADLNRDGIPELLFGTYSLKPQRRGGWSCSPPTGAGSPTPGCAASTGTATGSGCRPRRPSGT